MGAPRGIEAIGPEAGQPVSRAYFLGKMAEMNPSTWAPGDGLARPRRQSMRLSRLARAWRWLGPVERVAASEAARSGRSLSVEAPSWLGPGDKGRSTVPVVNRDRAAGPDPVLCAGSDRRGVAVSGSWPVADPRRNSVGSTPRWASETVDRNGCVTPMIEPRRAHPAMIGAPTRTDTRREPKVGARMRLLSSSLTMECGAVACPRLNCLRVHMLAKMRPPAVFWLP